MEKENKIETKTKIVVAGVATFVGILVWIISRLLKKGGNE